MDSVFNGITTIKRAVADPITDDTLPPPGKLAWRKINSPSAIDGTTAVDCKLVHGNCQMTFEQDVKTTIDGLLTATVKKGYNRTIKDHETRTNHGPVTSTFFGAVISTFHKTVMSTFMRKKTEIYNETSQIQDFLHYEHKPIDLRVSGFEQLNIGSKVELCGFEFGVIGYECSLHGAQTEATLLKAEEKGLGNEVSQLKNDLSLVSNKCMAAHSAVRSLEAKVGADVQGPPCSLGAN